MSESVEYIGNAAFHDTTFLGYGGEILSNTPSTLAGQTFISCGYSILMMAYEVNVSVSDSSSCTAGGTGWYIPGSEAVLRANPSEGYRFVGWYVGENLLSSEEEFRVNVSGDGCS